MYSRIDHFRRHAACQQMFFNLKISLYQISISIRMGSLNHQTSHNLESGIGRSNKPCVIILTSVAFVVDIPSFILFYCFFFVATDFVIM